MLNFLLTELDKLYNIIPVLLRYLHCFVSAHGGQNEMVCRNQVEVTTSSLFSELRQTLIFRFHEIHP